MADEVRDLQSCTRARTLSCSLATRPRMTQIWPRSVSIAEFDKAVTAAQGPPATAPSDSTAAVVRRVALLRNVFSEATAAAPGSDEFFSELEEDIATECSKCGSVLAVRAVLKADSGQEESFVEGTIRVVFGLPAEAEKCVTLMNGRKFDGRQLVARLALDEPTDPPAPAGAATNAATSAAPTPTQKSTTDIPATGDALLDSFFASLPT
eukprot:COSAG04_NODE_314_length_17063_cov_146.074982_2_plen_209_part_00